LMGAALETNYPTVDLTEVFVPIHPEPRVRITAKWWDLYSEGNSKLAYQILRNYAWFKQDRKHGQTNMTSHFLTPTDIKIRKNKPANEFGKIFI